MRPPDRPRAWPWLVALAGSGMLLGCLPHLLAFAMSGDPTYIADGDELLYLAWSRDAVRHGVPALTDAVHRPSGPMMHPWVLFVPEALLANALGLGPTRLGIVWRLLGGAGVALGLYAAVRPFSATPRAAAGIAAFLLFDAGLLFGQIGQRDVEVASSLTGEGSRFLAGVPRIMAHLRVPPPALAIPFLLVFYTLAHRARSGGGARQVLAAGVALGLLFHVYFYFATAAFVGIALAWGLDPAGRRAWARMIVVGLVVAAPAILAGASIKRSTPPDWLERSGKFVRVARLDPSRLLLPKVLIAEWAVAGWVVYRSRRDLLCLWSGTGAGLLLANQQVVTGLDMENFHWTYHYGITFSVLSALIVVPWLGRWQAWRWVGPVLLGVQVTLGLGLRTVEALSTVETNQYRTIRENWRAEGLTIPRRAVVAGPPRLLFLLAAIEEIDSLDSRLVVYSSAADDVELQRRRALNEWLSGPFPHEPDSPRMGEISGDLPGWAGRFGVTHVLIRSGIEPPAAIAERALIVGRGRMLDLWRIESGVSANRNL